MDALEVAIITVFISAICCVIYVTAVSTLNSYNISVGIFKCIKYVMQNPGSSVVVTVYAPYSISLTFGKYNFAKYVNGTQPSSSSEASSSVPYELCVGTSCIVFNNTSIQIALYVATSYNITRIGSSSTNGGTIMFIIPSGVHTIKCMSYWNYTDNKRFLQVIITLYR